MNKIIYSIFLLITICARNVHAEDYQLKVRLEGVKNNRGMVHVALYSDAKTFRKTAYALQIIKVPAAEGMLSAEFSGIPAGQYAILAFHDEDENGEMNKRLGMIPLEGYALSNNPKVMGPPTFKDSAFDIPATQEVTLIFHY